MDFKLPPDERYGKLPANFECELPNDGYIVIIGENDIGKSALLQYMFLKMHRGSITLTGDNILPNPNEHNTVYIPKIRDFIQPSIQPGSGTLLAYNAEIANRLEGGPIMHDASNAGEFSQLFRLLLNDHDLYNQQGFLKDQLVEDGFGEYASRAGQRHVLGGVEIPNHGSGIRGLMPIYAALTLDKAKYIIIDEPEASLEAGKQKLLRDRLIEACSKNGKTVIIATHSHLLLNRENPNNNLVLENSIKGLHLRALETEHQFQDLAFRMLGNSLSDLFLPDNYLFVEGASDQIILSHIASLIDDTFNLRVIACQGLQDVKPTIAAFEQNFRPIIEGKSPYAKKIVALLDKPTEPSKEKWCKELKKHLGERYFELHQASIEEYLPDAVYEKAGLKKKEQLERISSVKHDYKEQSQIKREISNAIAAKIEKEDLPNLQILVDAVNKAISD